MTQNKKEHLEIKTLESEKNSIKYLEDSKWNL